MAERDEAVRLAVEVLPHGEGLELPRFETPGAAGADVRAAVEETMRLAPGATALVPTGLRFAVPKGFEIQLRPRSGLALKYGITLPNSPGTIDSDYRGELKVIVMNLGREAFDIARGDRIAQLVLARVEQFAWEPVDSLDTTNRGAGGFGSTGRQ